MRIATIGLFAFVLADCGPAAASPTVGPVEPALTGTPAPAATVATDPCPVAITVTVIGTGLRREVIVSAENRHTGPQELVLPDRCPSGAVELIGLPAGYDYYGTCAMGACPGDRPAAHIGLGIGEGRELGRTTLDLGTSTCNAQVPAGEYRLSATVPGIEPTCVTSAALVVATPTPTPPAPKPTPTSTGIDFQACTADGDCIVHCPSVDGCCGWPCGCRNAINKAHKVAFDAHHARSCQKAPDCPAVACAHEPHHSARCVNNRCRSYSGFAAR